MKAACSDSDAALQIDDILTDTLVDGLFLPFRTRKFSQMFSHSTFWTTDSQTSVLEIIRQKVFPGDLDGAVLDFLRRTPSVLEYVQKHLHEKVEDFCMHAKRYLCMYLPNAGFEIGQTSRYEPSKAEACILATRDFTVGEEIRLCTGTLAYMSPDQENALSDAQQDFSVMYSSKHKCMGVMTGPARFANHDCKANCKFVPAGKVSVFLAVTRRICRGEEITTFYGEHYFGSFNSECKCATCKIEARGAFSRQEPSAFLWDRARRRSSGRVLGLTEGLELNRPTPHRIRKPNGRANMCGACSESGLPDDQRFQVPGRGWDCPRCKRHRDIFGLRWPNRTPSKQHYDLGHWQRAKRSLRVPRNLLYPPPGSMKRVTKLGKLNKTRLRKDLAGLFPGFAPPQLACESSMQSSAAGSLHEMTGPPADGIVQAASTAVDAPLLKGQEVQGAHETSVASDFEYVGNDCKPAGSTRPTGDATSAAGPSVVSGERLSVPDGLPIDLCLSAMIVTSTMDSAGKVMPLSTSAEIMASDERVASGTCVREAVAGKEMGGSAGSKRMSDVEIDDSTFRKYVNVPYVEKMAVTVVSNEMSRPLNFDDDSGRLGSDAVSGVGGSNEVRVAPSIFPDDSATSITEMCSDRNSHADNNRALPSRENAQSIAIRQVTDLVVSDPANWVQAGSSQASDSNFCPPAGHVIVSDDFESGSLSQIPVPLPVLHSATESQFLPAVSTALATLPSACVNLLPTNAATECSDVPVANCMGWSPRPFRHGEFQCSDGWSDVLGGSSDVSEISSSSLFLLAGHETRSDHSSSPELRPRER